MPKLQNNNIFHDIVTCSGIHNLACNCGANYILHTKRQFKQRLTEHKHDFKYSITDRSKFAAHLINKCHPLGPINRIFLILKIINNNKYIYLWEN